MKQEKQKLVDPKFAQLNKGDNKLDSDMRRAWRIPDKLMTAIMMVFKADQIKFLEYKGEAAWFSKTYPQFLLPEQY